MKLPPPQPPEVIREWDRRAIEEFGVPGTVLMENAGAQTARILLELASSEPETYREPWVILCGPGNNGGDGFVVARHLYNAGQSVDVHLAFDPERLRSATDNSIHLRIIEKMEIPIYSTGAPFPVPDVFGSSAECTVIDGLLGTGLSRELRSPYKEWVEAVNDTAATTIALDIPTGLDATTGTVLGAAIRARRTITFAAPKIGFELAQGPEIVGSVHVLDIGMPREIWEGSLR